MKTISWKKVACSGPKGNGYVVHRLALHYVGSEAVF